MASNTALIAEFLGTFLLILVVLASGGNALMIGGALAFIVWAIGKVSGAHVNPAISTAMFLRGSLSLNEFVAYVVSQTLAAAASIYTYRAFA